MNTKFCIIESGCRVTVNTSNEPSLFKMLYVLTFLLVYKSVVVYIYNHHHGQRKGHPMISS